MILRGCRDLKRKVSVVLPKKRNQMAFFFVYSRGMTERVMLQVAERILLLDVHV